jgi:hypothetical protein
MLDSKGIKAVEDAQSKLASARWHHYQCTVNPDLVKGILREVIDLLAPYALKAAFFRTFQQDVANWMDTCFGTPRPYDRKFRFLEEALELAQACECSKEDVLQLVNYVYSRPTGPLRQEIGGVMVTLAALCSSKNEDIERCAVDELRRCWDRIDIIRAKDAARQENSPLPGKVG